MLCPVLAQFVAAFDNPTTEENKEFWGKVCHRDRGGSGPTYLGGWVTAFCTFVEDGKCNTELVYAQERLTNTLVLGAIRKHKVH